MGTERHRERQRISESQSRIGILGRRLILIDPPYETSFPTMELMSQHEHIIVFFSFIIGLSLTELLENLRGLVQSHRTVHWHALPMLWVGILFLQLAQVWWDNYEKIAHPIYQNYFAFFTLLSSNLALYLACSFALPSDEDTTEVDLRQFYFSFSRRVWFFGALVGFVVVAQITTWLEAGTVTWGLESGARLVSFAMFSGLIVTKRTILHWGMAITFFCLLLGYIIQFSLRL